jgi:ubiquinone/menaquinone biosynthesis C-methylase UbiE
MENVHTHFSKIAYKYKVLRTTDPEPIAHIEEKLRALPNIVAADIGCGDGRYALELFQYFSSRLTLYCIDCNERMLEQLTAYLRHKGIRNFQVKQARASNLPIKDKTLDCVVTCNAIHHFRLVPFLKEVYRVLKDNGYLFIYTRTRSQNSRNIWGRYFPYFCEKETRLYELDELETILNNMPNLELESVKVFEYRRESTLDRLIEQAQNHHYSTFALYTKEESEEALLAFGRNLQERFENMEQIRWLDENVLLVVHKKEGESPCKPISS